MYVLIMLITFGLLYAAFDRHFSSRRDGLLAASVAFTAIAVALIEIASAGQWLASRFLAAEWAAAACGAACFVRSRPRPICWQRDWLSNLCLVAIACIAIGVGISAIFSPPNTWDAMTYHMPRVLNWIQHRSIAHYQTANLRQLYLGPCAEFLIAHFQILTGGDRLANIPQYLAMLGSVIGVSAITAKMGGSVRAQMLAALFAATLPIGILEASSAQTDYFAAFWVVCSINAGLAILQRPVEAKIPAFILLGAAVGLACLTKATTGLILFPFLLVMFPILAKTSIVAAFRQGAVLLAIAAAVNAGELYRNRAVFGHVLGPVSETIEYKNSLHTPGAVLSNVLRNIAINLSVYRAGFVLPLASRVIPIATGLSVDDPRITYEGTIFHFSYSRNEDEAGNPLHMLLGGIAVIAAIAVFRTRHAGAFYAICICAGCLIFCYELKWQPWITRLQLPMFVIAAPLVGLMLGRIRTRFATAAIALLMAVNAVPYVTSGTPRPLLGKASVLKVSRFDQYFAPHPLTIPSYTAAAKVLAQLNPQSVALTANLDDPEYFVRLILPPGVPIVHAGITNESQDCPDFDPAGKPAVLIALTTAPIPVQYSQYTVVFRSEEVRVLVRDPFLRN